MLFSSHTSLITHTHTPPTEVSPLELAFQKTEREKANQLHTWD